MTPSATGSSGLGLVAATSTSTGAAGASAGSSGMGGSSGAGGSTSGTGTSSSASSSGGSANGGAGSGGLGGGAPASDGGLDGNGGNGGLADASGADGEASSNDASANAADATCTPESDAALCARLSKNCGTLTANDNCGAPRTVSSCGSCAGMLTCGGGGTPNVCGGGIVTTIDDSVIGNRNNQVTYVGSGWGHCTSCTSGTGYYGSSNSWDNTPGDYATVTFVGTQIDFYTVLESINGMGAISIDGGSETNVDCSAGSAADRGNSLVWSSPVLAYGTHTFKIRVAGVTGRGSGFNVVVDRLDVR